MIGRIPEYLVHKAKLEGFCAQPIAAAYTTKKCSTCGREGQIGFLVQQQGTQYHSADEHSDRFEEWISPHQIPVGVFTAGVLSVLPHQVQLFPSPSPGGLQLGFLPSKAGHLFLCQHPQCGRYHHLIGRDRNASRNIARDDPFGALLEQFQIHWDRLERANPHVHPLTFATIPTLTLHPHGLRKQLKSDLTKFYDVLLDALMVDHRQTIITYLPSSGLQLSQRLKDHIEKKHGSRYRKTRWARFGAKQQLIDYVIKTHRWWETHDGPSASYQAELAQTPVFPFSDTMARFVTSWRIRLA